MTAILAILAVAGYLIYRNSHNSANNQNTSSQQPTSILGELEEAGENIGLNNLSNVLGGTSGSGQPASSPSGTDDDLLNATGFGTGTGDSTDDELFGEAGF